MKKGKFIFFEGMDFAGKTTCLRMLAKILEERGIPYITTREPGGSPLAEEVRRILLSDSTLSIQEQALLFQVARSHHCRNTIQPALDAGAWVLSDRYIISSLVYQNECAKLIEETTRTLNLIEPDHLVYAWCGKETTLKRRQSRGDDNFMDELFTKHYERYSKLFDHYASQAGDATLKLDTNNTQDMLEITLREFVDNIVGGNNG